MEETVIRKEEDKEQRGHGDGWVTHMDVEGAEDNDRGGSGEEDRAWSSVFRKGVGSDQEARR